MPVRAREHQIRAPKKCILGGLSRSAYWYRVTVYPYDGYITSSNPIVRHAMPLTWTMKRKRVNLHGPKHAATQPLHDSNTRAPAPNLVTCDIIGAHSRISYPAHVTVYPYNRYIRGTNPIVRHVMSLTWTLYRMRANDHATKHAATQPVLGSNAHARAPNLVTS